MTILDLLAKLARLPPDTEVIIYDPDSGGVEDVTGFVYDPEGKTVQLYSDDNT